MELHFLNINLSEWKDIATIVGVMIACATLIKGLFEFIIQGKQKRVEHFFNLRKKLKENEKFRKICLLLDEENDELIKIPFEDKRDFLGLFEEVAIMRNSKLIKDEIAFYMFGYYAILCWDSTFFWSSVNRESIYWKVFKKFVDAAKQFENGSLFNPDKIHI